MRKRDEEEKSERSQENIMIYEEPSESPRIRTKAKKPLEAVRQKNAQAKEEDKLGSPEGSEQKDFNVNESEHDEINWGGSSIKEPSIPPEENKSYQFNAKSINVDKSKNSDNIHDMIKEWEDEFKSQSQNLNIDEEEDEEDKEESDRNRKIEKSEVRRLGDSSAFDDFKSKFNNDEDEDDNRSPQHSNRSLHRPNSQVSSQRPLSQRPASSAAHEDLMND
eukprot:CAMPEP_0168323242 /NCGR_PEP_ID=MMETSP0213-20121227/3369_1 /TAXON_ID=151035 /ORGANISM="Euplotes harpa, Strain FSP1.4" /LENGTH=219 /DNA_ID=CAMNT_0008325285 /DNA_START=1526 /DNA_END=2182 /DNA_ORIENTATION=+